MSTVFFFPGQGAQYSGMGKDFYDTEPAIRELFIAASGVAGFDVADLIFNGTEEELKATDKTQIAITVVNVVIARYLQLKGVQPQQVAGFSLGEYSAMVIADMLSLENTLRAVIARGSIMEEVSRTHDTASGAAGLTAIIGLSVEQVADALAGCGDENVFVAIHNSPVQTVIGGTYDGMVTASVACEQAGAMRIVPLKVSGPFHTPLMEEARKLYQHELKSIPFSDPKIPIYSNVTGAVVQSGEHMQELAATQLVSRVEWVREQLTVIGGSGASTVQRIVEVGPGSVLLGLWRGLTKSLKKQSEDSGEGLPNFATTNTLEKTQELV